MTEDELAEAGVSIVIYANQLLRSAYPAMVQTAKTFCSTAEPPRNVACPSKTSSA